MAAVRGLRVSLKGPASSEPEPMEVEEGELLLPPPKEREEEEEPEEEEEGEEVEEEEEEEQKPLPPPPLEEDEEEEEEEEGGGGGEASGSLRRALPDTSRRYENKAGSFITGIDVTSKEAIEKKEQRAKRFHFRAEVNLAQRNVALDRDTMKKAIPKLRLDTLYVFGVDEMSTQDIFGYFKEYPPAHIEWLDDTSCNVVWLDEVTATRALINMSSMPEEEEDEEEKAKSQESGRRGRKEKAEGSSEDEAEEGEVEDDHHSQAEELDTLSQAEEDSLLRNDLRPAVKLAKGNKLFMRFATRDDKKELGAARRSQYYMKYGNPNYGGMKGILSNSWKRRYHSRRLHRDVVKKRALLGDEDVGRTPPYKHHRSGLVNVPEEEEEEEEDEQDMEEEEGGGGGRVVVEYRDELQAFRRARERSGVPRRPSPAIATASSSSSSSSGSDSDEMDYDLELKMISTPSPKKSLKMTMYADEVESQLKSIRNSMRADSMSSGNIKTRIGNKGPPEKKVTDVRLLLEEKRQGGAGLRLPLAPPTSAPKSDVRQRLGKRPHSPETPPLPTMPPLLLREPLSDVHSRLGIVKQDPQDRERDRERGEKKKKKAGALWARLGSAPKAPEKKKAPLPLEQHEKKVPPPSSSSSACLASPEEEDSALQRAWGALIQGKAHSRQQQQQQQQQQKSRLDHLPSLQIEISREESSSGSEADS